MSSEHTLASPPIHRPALPHSLLVVNHRPQPPFQLLLLPNYLRLFAGPPSLLLRALPRSAPELDHKTCEVCIISLNKMMVAKTLLAGTVQNVSLTRRTFREHKVPSSMICKSASTTSMSVYISKTVFTITQTRKQTVWTI